MTVREMIQGLIFNCDLDDIVECEVKLPGKDSDTYKLKSFEPARVYRIGDEKTSLIECYK